MTHLRMLFALLALLFVMLKMEAISLQPDSLLNDSSFTPRLLSSPGNPYDDFYISIPQYVPKSPTVSGLVEQIDYPVSLYTGVPDINIPIYEIEAYGMKMPITLSYHASGIRLSQEASWVGLGWSLNVGGLVSRTVKCADDFLEHDSQGLVNEGYLTAPELDYPRDSGYLHDFYEEDIFYRTQLVKDSEPDIFYYSLPGASGKFLIDKSRGPVLLSRFPNLKIELLNDTIYQNKKYFVITTSDGTRYTFGKYETTTNYSRNGLLNQNLPNSTKFDEYEGLFNVGNLYDTPTSYVSSWLLTDIESVNGRHITLNYEQESYQSPLQESATKHNILLGYFSRVFEPGGQTIYRCSKSVINTWRLSSIIWDAGQVNFFSSSREDEIGSIYDAPPLKLDSIKVVNKIGETIKNMAFTYSYFNNNYQGNYAHVFKRLKLLNLTDNQDANINYTFHYFDGNMPAKNSKNTDYWGYYNGIQQGKDYFCPVTYENVIYDGADKTSHLEAMRIGTLHSLSSPTKGETTFTYETNCYKVVPSTSVVTHHVGEWMNVYYENNWDTYQYPQAMSDTIHLSTATSVSVAGFAEIEGCVPDYSVWYDHGSYPTFRVRKVKNDGSLQTMFYYPTPSELLSDCSYTFPDSTFQLAPGNYVFEAVAQTKDTWYAFRYEMDRTDTITSDSIIHGGGLRVERIDGAVSKSYTYDGGKLLVEPVFGSLEYFRKLFYETTTEGHTQAHLYNMTCLAQRSESTIPISTLKDGNIFGYTHVTETVGNTKTCYTFFNDREINYGYDFPYTPTILNCLNGLVSRKEYGDGMKTEQYFYNLRETDRDVLGFVYDSGFDEVCEYSYHIEWPLLSMVRTTNIESNGSMVTENCYTYDDNFLPLTEDIRRGGDIYEKRYIYPSVLSLDSVARSMAIRHMAGVPLEVLLLKNGVVVDGRRTEYIDTLSMILPKTEYELDSKFGKTLANYGGSMVPKVYYRHYNMYGKPMEVWERGLTTAYLWSWNGLYPMAEVRNATYADLVSQMGTAVIFQITSANFPDNNSVNAVEGLRNAMPSSLTTTFGFKPLVGVTSITDPRGLTTHYEYDAVGRLKEKYIIDPSGRRNTMELYDYHYAE